MTEVAKINTNTVRTKTALPLLPAMSAALAIAFATQPAWAQATKADDNSSEIVVTAQKREESIQKVPISISVLSGKALDQQPTGGALEALSAVPGISQTSQAVGNSTSITIRGVAPGAPFLDGSGTVGYYIDSIPFSLVKSAGVPNTNAYDMARVEVLRGPQGTLYGASALNGVVRIITNDADPTKFEFKARGGLSTTQGGNPSFRTDAEVNIPIIRDRLAIRVVGGLENQGGWIDQPLRHKNNANNSLAKNLRAKLDARPTDNLKIDLSAWISRDHDDSPPYADSSGKQYTPLPIPQTTRYNAYNAKIVYDLPFMSVSSSTSHLDLRRTSYVDYSNITPTSQLYSNLPAKMFAEEFLLNSNGIGSWRWSAGAFYRNAHDDLYQTLPGVLAGPIYWRDSSNSYAGFGQITRTFADDRFELSGGLRYFHDDVGVRSLAAEGTYLPDLEHKTNFHAVTPRVVATWLPSNKLTFYASYSQGFRSGFNQSPLALVAAPNLAPVNADKLNNYEIGAKGTAFNGFVTFDTSVYYIKWDGVQQSAQVLYNGVYIGASINGSSASGIGTDIGLTLHPAHALEIGGSISYNDLKQDHDVVSQDSIVYPKGSRLAYSAAYTASAFMRYSVAVSSKFDAHFSMSANYHSEQSLRVLAEPVALLYSSGRPLLVNGSIDFANHTNQTVSLYVENLTNWNGLTQPATDASSMYRTRPRTVGVQFETKF